MLPGTLRQQSYRSRVTECKTLRKVPTSASGRWWSIGDPKNQVVVDGNGRNKPWDACSDVYMKCEVNAKTNTPEYFVAVGTRAQVNLWNDQDIENYGRENGKSDAETYLKPALDALTTKRAPLVEQYILQDEPGLQFVHVSATDQFAGKYTTRRKDDKVIVAVRGFVDEAARNAQRTVTAADVAADDTLLYEPAYKHYARMLFTQEMRRTKWTRWFPLSTTNSRSGLCSGFGGSSREKAPAIDPGFCGGLRIQRIVRRNCEAPP